MSAAGVNPEVTALLEALFGDRLVLRIHDIDPDSGEQIGGQRQRGQLAIEGIIGSPEGRSVGSPGDLRVRLDNPQLWQKITGTRTRTGWQLVGSGGGLAALDFLQDGVLVASRPAANFIGATVTDDPGNDRVDIEVGIPSRSMFVNGLPNPPTGSVDTAVMRFTTGPTNTGVEPVASWLTYTPSALFGDIFEITQRGTYAVRFQAIMINAADYVSGISYNALPAQLTGVPVGTQVQFANRGDFAQPTGVQSFPADGIVHVTQDDIDAGTNLIRCHASNSGGAPSFFIFDSASTAFQIWQTGPSI